MIDSFYKCKSLQAQGSSPLFFIESGTKGEQIRRLHKGQQRHLATGKTAQSLVELNVPDMLLDAFLMSHHIASGMIPLFMRA